MKKPNGLSVIECKYRESFWRIENKDGTFEIHDPIEEYQQRRDVDVFHLCGVYSKAGVPAEVTEIDYENYKQFRPSDGVLKNYSDLVYEGVRKGNAVLVPTGYCLYAPAIAGGIQRAIGTDKKIGVVWVDAHADNRIAEERPMTTFVGVPVSTLAGQSCEKWRKEFCGLEVPCEGRNMLMSDIRICEEESLRNMERAGVLHLTSSEFKDAAAWNKAVQELADRVDAIYLSIDMDILKNEFTPAYIKNVPGGHDIETVMRNARAVTQTGKVLAFSLFCADFDRYENQGEWTYFNAMKILAAGLEGWEQIPLDD